MLAFGAGVCFMLYTISFHNYLFFHSIAEIFSIIIAMGIFLVTWHTRNISENSYLQFIGVAFLFVGIVDFIHMLAYVGMGVFPEAETNLPTQLWIVARYIQSISLLVAPYFITRKMQLRLFLAGYGLITAYLIALIFYTNSFPVCFIEGSGFTPFKKYSEYVIALILLSAACILFVRRNELEPRVFIFMITSILITIVSELMFTHYINAYGSSNEAGHFLKIVAFYFLYRAIIVFCLERPYNSLFRNLHISEERYRGIVEDQTEMICRWRLDGTITFVNREYCCYFGRSRQELLGTRFALKIPKEDRPIIEDHFRKLTPHNPVETCVHRVITADGKIRRHQWTNRLLLDEKGEPTEYQSVGSDITERMEAEEKEREIASARTARETIEAMTDSVVLCAVNGRWVTLINPAFCALTGYNHSEIIGQTVKWLLELIFPAIDKDVGDDVLNMLLEGKIPQQLPQHIVTKDNRQVPVLITPSCMYDSGGKIKTIVFTIKDMTQQRKAESEKKILEEQLVSTRQMQMLGQLTSGVAHEVRNPLNTIIALTEAMFQKIPDSRKYETFLEHIRGQVKRLSDLMNELLEFGRPLRAHDMQTVDLVPFVRSACSSWKQTTVCKDNTVDITTQDETQSWLVHIDPIKMQQVFINLLDNAGQHSPPKSAFRIIISDSEKSGMVSVKCVDQGEGVREDNMPKLFEPFFTTREKGAGLGLNIVKNCVEYHGGTIRLYNNSPEPGLTAEILLPLVIRRS